MSNIEQQLLNRLWNAAITGEQITIADVREIEALIAQQVREARIDENQRRLDKFIEWENRKPVPGELTAASFGSAGASITASGFKHSFEDRIKELGDASNN